MKKRRRNESKSRPVVVTGIGLVTALGDDRARTWQALLSGKRGLRWLGSECELPVGGRRRGLELVTESLRVGGPAPLLEERLSELRNKVPAEVWKFCDEPVTALALVAAVEAVEDAGLEWPVALLDRRGACVVGTSKGGVWAWRGWFERRLRHLQEEEADERVPALVGVESERGREERARQNAVAEMVKAEAWGRPARRWSGASGELRSAAGEWLWASPSTPAAVVAAVLGLQQAAVCPVAACATGLASVAYGAELVGRGECDVAVVGSSDVSLHPLLLAGYRRMGVLARGFNDPAEAVRPFDCRRNGFLVGEGAAVLVLESLEQAVKRDARIYAEWVGHGWTTDCSGLVSLDSNPEPLVYLVQRLLEQNGVEPSQLGLLNLHGTATVQNDRYEAVALQQVLGNAVNHSWAFAAKGALGHLLGATGSVELALTALALHEQVVPPTVNLSEQDEVCHLRFATDSAQPARFRYALKLSLGFGGHLMAALLRRPLV